jgi:hypothetical protein
MKTEINGQNFAFRCRLCDMKRKAEFPVARNVSPTYAAEALGFKRTPRGVECVDVEQCAARKAGRS